LPIRSRTRRPRTTDGVRHWGKSPLHRKGGSSQGDGARVQVNLRVYLPEREQKRHVRCWAMMSAKPYESMAS